MPIGLHGQDPDDEDELGSSDADLLRSVTGDPTTYDLLLRIIELLEGISAKQDLALAAPQPHIEAPDPFRKPIAPPGRGGSGRYPAQQPSNVWHAGQHANATELGDHVHASS